MLGIVKPGGGVEETWFFLFCVCLKMSVIKKFKNGCTTEASKSFGCTGTCVCGSCENWCKGEL